MGKDCTLSFRNLAFCVLVRAVVMLCLLTGKTLPRLDEASNSPIIFAGAFPQLPVFFNLGGVMSGFFSTFLAYSRTRCTSQTHPLLSLPKTVQLSKEQTVLGQIGQSSRLSRTAMVLRHVKSFWVSNKLYLFFQAVFQHKGSPIGRPEGGCEKSSI